MGGRAGQRLHPHMLLAPRPAPARVWARAPRLVLGEQRLLHAHHVVLRDALGDAHDQGHLRLDRLEDRCSGGRRRHVEHRRVSAGPCLGLRDRGEHGQPQVLRARLLGVHPADHLRAIVDGLLAVESAGLASEPLANDLRAREHCRGRWPRFGREGSPARQAQKASSAGSSQHALLSQSFGALLLALRPRLPRIGWANRRCPARLVRGTRRRAQRGRCGGVGLICSRSSRRAPATNSLYRT